MTEQDYKDKLAVRNQLSQADKLSLLEFEFNILNKRLVEKGIFDAKDDWTKPEDFTK